MVRDKAWLLEDQVKILGKQTEAARRLMARRSCRRKLIVYGTIILSFILILNKSILIGVYSLFERPLHRLFGRRSEQDIESVSSHDRY